MMRLDKYLSCCGVGSRKTCRLAIRQGHIQVNGVLIRQDDYTIDEWNDRVEREGIRLHYQPFIYLMMNKPQGVISATTDKQHQTILDLVNDFKHRDLFPVGRLDRDSEGLLLLSDDGRLAHQLLSPKNHVEKEYLVHLDHELSNDLIDQFYAGIMLEDGYVCQPATLRIIDHDKAHVVIHEGKYHQIKRMFRQLGYEVTFLKRVRFHSIWLDSSLQPGEYRSLTIDEITRLKARD
jgi:16S rRNA pseudouridine516 synthase